MTTTNIEPLVITTLGVSSTFSAPLELAEGRPREGIQALLTGIICTNIGAQLGEMTPIKHGQLVKGALGTGAAGVALSGALQMRDGVRKGKVAELFKGVLKAAIGSAGTVIIYGLNPERVALANQAALTLLAGGYFAKLGINDLMKGSYRTGLCKIALGAGGIASAVYVIYSASSPELSEREIAFLKAHEGELEEMYRLSPWGDAPGKWKVVGRGASKIAFVHPELEGRIIKTPIGREGYRGKTGEDDLIINYERLQKMRAIATRFDRLVIPQSSLYQTPAGKIIVEEKLDLTEFDSVLPSEGKIEAVMQLEAFLEAAGLCDVTIQYDHNAGILAFSDRTKIGVYDFDCEKNANKRHHWNWDFRNPGSRFFQPQNRNQITALVCAGGAAVLGGVSKMAKRIGGIQPKTVLRAGVITGVIAAAVCAIQSEVFNQPAFTLYGTGIAMAAAAIVTPVVAKASRWVKSGFGFRRAAQI